MLKIIHMYLTGDRKKYVESSQSPLSFKKSATQKKSILGGCYHVYLDVGSNVGVQVRKLFQPEEYPKANAGMISQFRLAFGG